MQYDDHEIALMKKDPVARIHKMDENLVAHWKTLSVPELYQYRDNIVNKLNMLTRDQNPEMIRTMQDTIRDVEDYIYIRQQRENSGVDNSDIIL